MICVWICREAGVLLSLWPTRMGDQQARVGSQAGVLEQHPIEGSLRDKEQRAALRVNGGEVKGDEGELHSMF